MLEDPPFVACEMFRDPRVDGHCTLEHIERNVSVHHVAHSMDGLAAARAEDSGTENLPRLRIDDDFHVWTSKYVGTLLYGLGPQDPVTIASSAVVLAIVAALAGWMPVYRAIPQ